MSSSRQTVSPPPPGPVEQADGRVADATVSIVIPCYTADRWDSLMRAIASATEQTVPCRVVVVVDHNDALRERLAAAVPPGVTVLANRFARGVSGARNTGAFAADTDVVAFLDDDAVAARTWVAGVLEPLRSPAALGVGTAIVGRWDRRPAWFPDEFGWVVGLTSHIVADDATPVRNVWSNGMAVRRAQFDEAGGFRDEFGKLGSVNEPEDTELCLRMSRDLPGAGDWYYLPGVELFHEVPARRTTFGYFVHRCWLEGSGKASLLRTGDYEATTLTEEGRYSRLILVKALLRYLGQALRGRVAALGQAAALIVGFLAAVGGFVAGSLRNRGTVGSPRPGAGRPRATARLQALLPRPRLDLAARLSAIPEPEFPGEFHPILVRDVELSAPLPDLRPTAGEPAPAEADLLVVLNTQPLGTVHVPLGPQGCSATQLADAIQAELGPVIAERVRAAGGAPAPLTAAGITDAVASPYLAERAEILAHPPVRVSVVLCTRDPDRQHLTRALESLAAQVYPDREIIVVDNAPTTDTVASVVAQFADDTTIRRVVEPRPGLSRARNRGLAAAEGDLIAFFDDDEIADPTWLAEVVRGFRSQPQVGAVTGPVRPLFLDSPVRVWFEQFGGLVKGRGFDRWVFDKASHRVQHPLYPTPSFGVGANMTFDRTLLVELGGFDEALGAGTPVRSAEDGTVLSHLMLDGHTVVYEPGAIVRHEHRANWNDLTKQFYGLGLGVTAFYMRLMLTEPKWLPTLLRLLPKALREQASDDVRLKSGTFPVSLRTVQRRGMLLGPFLYLWSRHVARRKVDGSQATPWSRSD